MGPQVQDDDSSVNGSELGSGCKVGISNYQLEHNFISVEALSPEDLQYFPNTGIFRRICSPHVEKEDSLIIVRWIRGQC